MNQDPSAILSSLRQLESKSRLALFNWEDEQSLRGGGDALSRMFFPCRGASGTTSFKQGHGEYIHSFKFTMLSVSLRICN